uniref:Uncharacterized protein n=1 Tax=Rhizophora mucronata TaxID=61149 RepID=A0A2P2NMM0_RHIMU
MTSTKLRIKLKPAITCIALLALGEFCWGLCLPDTLSVLPSLSLSYF